MADLSTMWLEISIPEEALSRVRLGDFVDVPFETLPKLTSHSQISWIAVLRFILLLAGTGTGRWYRQILHQQSRAM